MGRVESRIDRMGSVNPCIGEMGSVAPTDRVERGVDWTDNVGSGIDCAGDNLRSVRGCRVRERGRRDVEVRPRAAGDEQEPKSDVASVHPLERSSTSSRKVRQ